MKDEELEKKWNETLKEISATYGDELDMQAIIFLIGVQELGRGYQKFSKDQKLDVMHIAICRLLSGFGYYRFIGTDQDGWPHWEATEKLPFLKPGHQVLLMKEAIIDYFEKEIKG